MELPEISEQEINLLYKRMIDKAREGNVEAMIFLLDRATYTPIDTNLQKKSNELLKQIKKVIDERNNKGR
jgi:hypothetical protein